MLITAAQSRAVLEAAESRASSLGVNVNVALVDAGVHLKAFTRMDGAVLGSIDIAIKKARTAALFAVPSEAVWQYCKPGAPAHFLELTNGGLAPFAGGLPLHDAHGELLGAVGVSGGTVAQDAEIAEAAAGALDRTSTESRNRAVVEAAFRAWSDGTGSPFDLLRDDATWTIVGRSVASKSYQGREAFVREVIRPFNARLSEPLKPSVRRIYADGDHVIVFFDATGTARDGEPYSNTYAWFFEMREGRVLAATAFFDSVEFNELWARVAPDAQEPIGSSRHAEPA